ncbi:uncharacterized protein PG986_011215, partial [Apiospora aurea]
VEDYPPGYPRFTALVSAHGPYFVCRRFNKLRARLLLLKQDRLALLEQKLEEIDRKEACPLFLGKSRGTGNPDRETLLLEIESHLADYDQFTEKTSRTLSSSPARPRDVKSLQNWVEGTGCIAREESAYLMHYEELMTLGPKGDSAIQQLEAWVEDKCIACWRGFRKSQHNDASNDPNVYIYSGPLIQRTARGLLLSLITVLLIMPIVICNIINTSLTRIVVAVLSIILYLLVLSGLTNSGTMELILAGATSVLLSTN